MPRRKHRAKPKPKRKNNRNFRLSTAIVPRTRMVKLPYSEQFSITTAATLQHYLFRANSIFDPNYSGGGHQPLYHDEMSALYHHYCVVGSRIRLKAINKDTGDGQIIGIGITPSATTSASMAEYTEQPSTSIKMIGEMGSGNNVGYLTKTWSAKKQFGGTPISNPNLVASFGSNPTEISNFDVAAYQTAFGSYGGIVWFEADIEYIVVLTEPKVATIS